MEYFLQDILSWPISFLELLDIFYKRTTFNFAKLFF